MSSVGDDFKVIRCLRCPVAEDGSSGNSPFNSDCYAGAYAHYGICGVVL